METDPIYGRYISIRATLYRRLDALRAEVDEWLTERASLMPSMAELARLEALHGERHRLLRELESAEERFVDHVVRLIGEASAARLDGSS